MNLRGKIAIITGSTGRLGSTITKALAQAGCHCICHYHQNERAGQELAEYIRTFAVKARLVKADLTCPKGIESLFDKAQKLGIPDILINSAATFSRHRLSDVTFDQAREIFDLNLTAPIMASRAFAGIINQRFPDVTAPVAKIINIADVGALKPWAGYVTYCASKAGLIGATKALAKELAPAVCVNSVAPGVVRWPSGFDDADKHRQLSFVPLRRIAQPKEVTDAIIFLLKNDYITGQILCIDGGRSI
ncbi:MAG: SDR family oxidoreductase [Sedimentisphaerales bacterium]|nr:SDR family oxidoreductase [Sedimentisphaerales bacterium]